MPEKYDLMYARASEAKNLGVSNCEFCKANIALAKKLKARCIINKKGWDVIGIEAPMPKGGDDK